MQKTNPAHPSEEELERFVLHQCHEQELEEVETHILACESCVTRLEDLEVEISAMKLGLQKMLAEQQIKRSADEQRSSWKAWVTVPKLSFAGALAAVVLGVIALPALLHRDTDAAQVSLTAYRANETSVVPAARRLLVHLNARDLADGIVSAALVDLSGVEVWKGRTTVHNEQAELEMPPITEKGIHYLRLYSPVRPGSEPQLLREFSFQVK
jgi:hypothetical protein